MLVDRIVLLVLLVGMCLGGAKVQADTIPHLQYSTPEGLPNKEITALAQTNNGLLWIGTKHGLVVYDGHQFRPIPMPDSVREKSVLALEPMPDGTVWAGVGHDAVKVAPHGAVRTHLLDSHHLVEILRRGDRIWFVTHLAVWEQRAAGSPLSRTRFRYETLQDVTLVKGADLDAQGQVWIVNKNRGPGRVQPDGQVDFADPSSEDQRNAAFHDLRFSADGTALVTQGAHLYRFDPKAESFATIGKTSGPVDIHRRGRRAYLTGAARVLRYDTGARRFLKPVGATQDLPNATTTNALRGREGGLWIGTQEAGLLHFPAPETRHVTSIDGESIRAGAGFRQQGGALWANTWGAGLYQLRPERRHVAPDGHTRWVLLSSQDGRLHGLTPTKVARRGREWYQWTQGEEWQFEASARRTVRGYVDSSGIGYFWHNEGLYRHEPDGDSTRATRIWDWPLERSQHHLMGPAPNGDIILFDEGVVLRLRRPDGAVIDTIATVPEHATSAGRRLTIDPKGRIWVPFASLLRIDPSQGTTQTLLEGAVIEKVTVAGDSLAMANTNEGLYLLDANTGAVRRHLTRADGLLSNDVNGAHLMKDTLYVGHKSGLTLMPTDSLFVPPPRPRTILTGREINLKDRALPGDSVLDADERAVGFTYTGTSLMHSDRVRYEVRLAPRDTTWSVTDRRFVRYTNLEPGTYRFKVRARLAGQPPGPVASRTFTIPPHFYETWWFQLLAVLGLVGLYAGAYRWRTHRLEKRKEALEAAVEERTRELAKEKQKTQEQAERLADLDEAKNRFFAHISHEFRTPLSLILSPLRDAQQRATEGAATVSEGQLRRMTGNAERLQRLIDQLLDLATLEAGQMELDRQPGNVGRLIQRTAESFRSRAEENDLDLRIQGPSGRIAMRFDPEKVETIVSNLVGNAVKFTPEGGSVTVRVEETEAAERVDLSEEDGAVTNAIRVEVEDTGPGIGPEAQAQIFDRFQQVDNSLTREHEGTGLGLALTKQLVELHGGTIAVESTSGVGSRFIVHFPLVPVAAGDGAWEGESMETKERGSVPGANGEEEGARNRGSGGAPVRTPEVDEEGGPREERPTILVVEDNAEMRAYLQEELSPRWTVLQAADGEEGWETVQEETPDLILSDVMMPETDGFELCRRVKDDPDLRTIPVLLLTARADEEATLQGLESGADDYVAKPFGSEELKRRIENHLAARQHLEARYREEVTIEELGTVIAAEEQPFVEEVLEAIEEQLSDPDFGVGDLADAVALSRRQLTRRLKKTVEMAPGELLKQRRLKRAKETLKRDPGTIAEVGYAVGFRSSSHFSNVFREEIGQTPTEFVEQRDG